MKCPKCENQVKESFFSLSLTKIACNTCGIKFKVRLKNPMFEIIVIIIGILLVIDISLTKFLSSFYENPSKSIYYIFFLISIIVAIIMLIRAKKSVKFEIDEK